MASGSQRNVTPQAHCCWVQDYEGRKAEQFDGCIANILAGPLVELAPLISAAVRPGGWLAMSGILASQVCERMFALEEHDRLIISTSEHIRTAMKLIAVTCLHHGTWRMRGALKTASSHLQEGS